MTATQKLNAAERFFFEHAGYSYDPKTQTAEQGRLDCAKVMAAAEALFQEVEACCNWAFRVGADHDCSAEDGEPRFDMRIEDADGRCRALLGGIDDGGTTYSRIVRANLACELLADMREALAAEDKVA